MTVCVPMATAISRVIVLVLLILKAILALTRLMIVWLQLQSVSMPVYVLMATARILAIVLALLILKALLVLTRLMTVFLRL
jgi:hypothetical protein